MSEQQNKDSFVEIWRGISILLVVAFHYTNRLPPEALGASVQPSIVFHAGKLGVYIFFIISGFLIARSLEACTTLAEFYAKRLSRIWPLFIAASIFIYVFLLIFSPPVVTEGPKQFYGADRSLVDLFGTIFFLEDLGFDWIDGVFWSILVELKFYFFVGLFAVCLRKDYVEGFARTSLVLASIDLAILLFHGEGAGGSINRLLHGVLIAQYAPFFAVGLLLHRGRHDALFIANAILCVVQVSIAVSGNTDFDVIESSKFILLLVAVVAADRFLLESRIMQFFGAYAYSIYLFHQMIGLTVMSWIAPHLGLDAAIIIAFIAVVALSWIASELFEWRYRRIFARAIHGALSMARLDVPFIRTPQAAPAALK